MNLIIDQGNSLIKTAVFDHGRLLHKYSFTAKEFSAELATTLRQFPELNACLLASVGSFSPNIVDRLERDYTLLLLDSKTPVPFENKYLTPDSLGVDRIGLAAAATKFYPGKAVLVIDSGTCITYDLVTEHGAYIGGVIAPGIRMRYRALNNYTSRLPLLQPEAHPALIGDSTAASMHSGVIRGVCLEADGYITSLRNNYPGLVVVLTGGDAHFLRYNLKSDIFAHSNFLLEGLNHILEFNLNKC